MDSSVLSLDVYQLHKPYTFLKYSEALLKRTFLNSNLINNLIDSYIRGIPEKKYLRNLNCIWL